MSVGITASRAGLTIPQKTIIQKLLARVPEDKKILHHGDCVGGDAAICDIAKFMGFKLIAHPPFNETLRAYFPSDETRDPKDYLARNHDIVDETIELLAAPNAPEVLASGTWATVRYARKVGKPIMIVHPDGSTELDGSYRASRAKIP